MEFKTLDNEKYWIIRVAINTSKRVDTIDRMVYVGDTYYLLAVNEVQIFEVNDGKFEFRKKVVIFAHK